MAEELLVRDSLEEELFEKNQGLIWSIVRRFFGRGVEPEDLFQIGAIGLIKAIRGYDESYGTAFSTYAVPKIMGEILRFFRDDGMVKVSRPQKREAAMVLKARELFEKENGREPRLSELSELTGLTPEDIASADLALMPVRSFEEKIKDDLTLGLRLGVNPEESMVERIGLAEAVNSLGEEEAMVIRLRFFKGLTQEQVAKIMNTTQVQVSRIQKKAIERLRWRVG